MQDWKRNVFFSWIGQFFSIMGFGFAIPFAPFYLQELGIQGDAQIRLWSGMFGAVVGISMAITTPFWGYLADRVGRKPMILRASLGGAVTLFGMGLVRSPEMLLALRVLQGVFTGTVTAYLTLVVSTTPKERLGLAVGLMNSAVFCGNSVSPLIGGVFADMFGYRKSFFVSAILLTASFLISIIFVHEDFTPDNTTSFSFFSETGHLLLVSGVASAIGMIFWYSMARTVQSPVLPLLVQEISSSGAKVATLAGRVSSASGAAAVLAGIVAGTLIDRRVKSVKIGMWCAFLGSGCALFPIWAGNVWQLGVMNFIFALWSGGLDPIFNVMLARLVPIEKRGVAFGLFGSARAFGWAAGAFSGGLLAATFGLRSVFLATAIFFAGLGVWLGFFETRRKKV